MKADKKASKVIKTKTIGAKSIRSKANREAESDHWNLRLYVAGQTPRSLTAFSNLVRLCKEHLTDRYSIEVIDLLKEPQLAEGDQILAIPTLDTDRQSRLSVSWAIYPTSRSTGRNGHTSRFQNLAE